MKAVVSILTALFVFTSSALAAPGAAAPHQLVYEFGYNTKVASSGNGTGTTTIAILGSAADGGVTITGTDHWWNTPRPRATNTCEVYPGGAVACSQAPYAISPMQLTIFPLLARGYFGPLNAGATSSWTRSFAVKAAILPGASGFAGQLYTWKCAFSLQGKGPIANAAPLVLIEASGTLDQLGGRYLKATSKQRIVYDPVRKVPAIIRDVRTHLPQRTVYNSDSIELKLTHDSQSMH